MGKEKKNGNERTEKRTYMNKKKGERKSMLGYRKKEKNGTHNNWGRMLRNKYRYNDSDPTSSSFEGG